MHMYIILFWGKTICEIFPNMSERYVKIPQIITVNYAVCHTYDTNFAVCRNFTGKFVQNA